MAPQAPPSTYRNPDEDFFAINESFFSPYNFDGANSAVGIKREHVQDASTYRNERAVRNISPVVSTSSRNLTPQLSTSNREDVEDMPRIWNQRVVKSNSPGLSRSVRNSTLQAREVSTLRKSPNYPKWCEIEDIFLHGVVMDTYERRHSLKPFKRDKSSAKRAKLSQENLVWVGIHQRYCIALERYKILKGLELGPRTVRALQKRWKLGDNTSDHHVDDDGCFIVQMPRSKLLRKRFDEEFNVEKLLTCPKKEFQAYLRKQSEEIGFLEMDLQ